MSNLVISFLVTFCDCAPVSVPGKSSGNLWISVSGDPNKVHRPREALSAVQVFSVKAVGEGRHLGEPQAFLVLDRC